MCTTWRKEFRVSIKSYTFKWSIWVWIALAALAISCVLYMVAFCTDGWGIIQENDPKGTWYAFGLWQQCAFPHRLCFSPVNTPALGAARAFAVLALFGNVFSIALLLGYMFEKILDFDDCMIITWTSVCFATAVFTFISVVTFGTRVPLDLELLVGPDKWLSYSFGLACVTIFLQLLAGAMGVLEVVTFVPEPVIFLPASEFETDQRRKARPLASIEEEVLGEPENGRTTQEYRQEPYRV